MHETHHEGSRKSATKNDIELEKIRQRGALFVKLASGFTILAGIYLFGEYPLRYVYLTILSIAGKDTKMSGSVATMVATMVGGGSGVALLVYGSGWAKMRSQSSELKRLRKRNDELEHRLMDRPAATSNLPSPPEDKK